MTLSTLTTLTGLEVLDYLDQEVSVPAVDGIQAQGDLLVVPHRLLKDAVVTTTWTRTVDVPLSGIELLRSAAGGNPHSLVADEGVARWSTGVSDTRRLALGILDTSVVAYLIHPEHGATGIAPGRYVIGRQREGGASGYFGSQLVAD